MIGGDLMHTDYLYLARERIAELHRDAERQRLGRDARRRVAHLTASSAARPRRLDAPIATARAGAPPHAGD
ncbi:MAG TPA: hypothetical protein VHK06_05405 [Candidatus Limnocylindria bacterium]|nr:hypothetical protein [Candidatus Limnocylindria bacterium]